MLSIVSWNIPTVRLRYAANIPGMTGHHWSSAIAMATPIAHKGSLAGAKAMAMTMVDIVMKPELVADAKKYFAEVQTKDVQYQPFIRPQDQPVTTLNANIMATYREQMRKYYYDPSRHATYLEQLGIAYPTVRPCGPAIARTRRPTPRWQRTWPLPPVRAIGQDQRYVGKCLHIVDDGRLAPETADLRIGWFGARDDRMPFQRV